MKELIIRVTKAVNGFMVSAAEYRPMDGPRVENIYVCLDDDQVMDTIKLALVTEKIVEAAGG